jgi:exopolysaccharide biosynthesis protein
MFKKIASIFILLTLLNTINVEAASFHKKQVNVGGNTYTSYIIEVDQKDNVNIANAGSKSKVGGIATIGQMVRWTKAIGGINAGFFKMDTHLPLGIIYKSDQLYTGTLFDRTALIGYKDNTYEIKRLHFEGSIEKEWWTGSYLVDSYNQPRLSKNQVIVYDSKWTNFVPSIFKNGKLLVIKDGVVVVADSRMGVRVPPGGQVLYGPATRLSGLKVGDKVKFTYKISDLDLSKVKFIVSGGPRLLQDGQIVDNVSAEKFSCNSVCYNARRTAVAIKSGKLYFITVPQAISLSRFSQLLSALGYEQAINFDGGGSSQMFYDGLTYMGGRQVNNGLVVY